jgi:hypothetical protein
MEQTNPPGLFQYKAQIHVIDHGGWYPIRIADVLEETPFPCTQLNPIRNPFLNIKLLPRNLSMYMVKISD